LLKDGHLLLKVRIQIGLICEASSKFKPEISIGEYIRPLTNDFNIDLWGSIKKFIISESLLITGLKFRHLPQHGF
jgi:hypothetical protein